MSGVDKPNEGGVKKSDIHLDYERIRALEVRAKCHESNFQGVDILLTVDWPKGKYSGDLNSQLVWYSKSSSMSYLGSLIVA